MDDDKRVQAVLLGIKPERFIELQELGIAVEQFDLFSRFGDEALSDLAKLKLDPTELVKIVQDSHGNIYTIKVYAKLRARGLSAGSIASLKSPSDLLDALKAGLSVEEATRLLDAGVPRYMMIEAHQANISLDEVAAAARVRSTSDYVKARQQGYGHDELLDVMRMAARHTPNYRGFELEDYLKVRATAVTHEEVMTMLTDERVDHHSRGYYVEYITHERNGLSHEQAYTLATYRLYPNYYWGARSGVEHDYVIKALQAGIPDTYLEEFGAFLANNCRITPDEVLQYWSLAASLTGVNRYIKLLDAGFDYTSMLAARKAGVGLSAFASLRAEWLLTQQEVLEVAASGIALRDYTKLRDDGLIHSVIISSLQKAA
jgi:hypothetical protein